MKQLLAVALATVLVGCGSSSGTRSENSPSDNTNLDINPITGERLAQVQFIAMGDSGSGSAGHYAVGEAMATVCAEKELTDGPCQFVLGFGDNIYEDGVNSVDDIQFEDKFEKPFEPVGEIPFYMVLGNHDNTAYIGGDGANNERGEFQVEYGLSGKSPRWKMPARYYAVSTNEIPTIDGGVDSTGKPLIHIVGLDSNPLTAIIADGDDRYSWQNYSLGMLEFLKREMETDAVFKIGMAHHPYLSNGTHGNAGSYDGFSSDVFPAVSGQRWKEFLEEGLCDKADYFMNGHDHDLEILTPVSSCGRTGFVLSGAAGKFRSFGDESRNNTLYQVDNTYGFIWMKAVEANIVSGAPAKMCMEVYSVDPATPETTFGVFADGELTPDFVTCVDQKTPVGMPSNTAFSSNTVPATVPLAAMPQEYDADYRGIMNDFRSTLIAGLNSANQGNPNNDAGIVAADMIVAMDMLLSAMDGIATSVATGSNDYAKAIAAIQAAAEHLNNVDTSSLPAPFDQLDDAFEAFAGGAFMLSEEEASSGTDDIGYIAAPLVSLAANLANIVDALHEQTTSVPVVRGVTGLLAALVVGVSDTLGYLVTLDVNDSQEALIGGIDRGLKRLVAEIEVLQTAPQPIPNAVAGLAPDVLATIIREVAEQLDRRATGPLSEIIDIALTPFTNIIRNLIDFVID